MNTSMRSPLATLARALVTLLLILYVVSRVDPAQALNDLRRMAWWGPAGAGLLMILNIGLQWLRWHLLVRAGDLGLSPAGSFRVLLAGYPLGLITPGRIGELGRGAVVSGEHDSVAVAGLTMLEHAFGLVGAVGVAFLGMIISGYGTTWKWAILLILYGALIYTALHPYRLVGWARALAPILPASIKNRVSELAGRFAQGWRLAGRRVALAAIAISILQFITVVTQFTICYSAVAYIPALVKIAGAWSVVLGAKYFLPITIGDVGVREGLAVAVFADLAMPTPAALVAALMIYLLNVIVPASVGAVILARRR